MKDTSNSMKWVYPIIIFMLCGVIVYLLTIMGGMALSQASSAVMAHHTKWHCLQEGGGSRFLIPHDFEAHPRFYIEGDDSIDPGFYITPHDTVPSNETKLL